MRVVGWRWRQDVKGVGWWMWRCLNKDQELGWVVGEEERWGCLGCVGDRGGWILLRGWVMVVWFVRQSLYDFFVVMCFWQSWILFLYFFVKGVWMEVVLWDGWCLVGDWGSWVLFFLELKDGWCWMFWRVRSLLVVFFSQVFFFELLEWRCCMWMMLVRWLMMMFLVIQFRQMFG